MIKYFVRAFRVTNENIILATPLILFLFLLSIYLGVAQNAPSNAGSAILLLITILFMISAFFAGWFFMVKKAIDLDKKEFIIDEDKAKSSFLLLKEIPLGVGEYFFSFIGALILYSVLIGVIIFVTFHIGLHTIGKTGVGIDDLKMALSSTAAMKSMISSLSVEQLAKLNAWNALFLVTMSAFSFITMFWGTQIVTYTKNPFIAFFKSLSFTFRHFLSAIALFVYISVINFLISLLNAFSMANPIVYFISMIIYFYFVVYVVVLIFLYYDGENNRQNYAKIEGNSGSDSSDNSNSGADCIREEQSGDSNSTED